jgi:hypothetical protein
MPRLVSFFCLVATLATICGAAGTVEGRGDSARFISQRYGFSMAVPSGWSPSVSLDTPVYFYSSSGRFIQAAIPEGGAVITVTAHDTVSGISRSATTPSEWAAAECRAFSAEKSPISPFEMPSVSMASMAVVTAYDEPKLSRDQQIQHSVGVFWEFRHMLFAAHLNYNANDPNGPAMERLFLETIRGIRPLRGLASR